MDQSNGVCWVVTDESKKLMERITYYEIFLLHDPGEDINTEDVFFE